MANEHTQTAEQSVRLGNHPPRGLPDESSTKNGYLLMLRWFHYQKNILRGLNISQPVIMQMAMLDHALRRRKLLYMSCAELAEGEAYKYWRKDRKRLAEEFYAMAKRGFMCRAYRDSLGFKKGKVLVWGLTGEGKRLLREYYAYMGGAHDEPCWLW